MNINDNINDNNNYAKWFINKSMKIIYSAVGTLV